MSSLSFDTFSDFMLWADGLPQRNEIALFIARSCTVIGQNGTSIPLAFPINVLDRSSVRYLLAVNNRFPTPLLRSRLSRMVDEYEDGFFPMGIGFVYTETPERPKTGISFFRFLSNRKLRDFHINFPSLPIIKRAGEP